MAGHWSCDQNHLRWRPQMEGGEEDRVPVDKLLGAYDPEGRW